MPDVGINVAGRRVVQPGVTAIIDTSGFNAPPSNPLKRGLIIGDALGGDPQTFITLTPETYAGVMKGGNALKAADLAVTPSPVVPGLGEFEFYRVNAAVAASLAMGDLTLTALPTHAGVYGNAFTAKRTLHTDGVAKILELIDTNTNLIETSPPLGPALKITYLGGAVTPTAAITLTSGVLTLDLGSDGPASETVSFTLGAAGNATFAALADAINATVAWSAEVQYQHHTMDPSKLTAGALTLSSGVTTLDLGIEAQITWLASGSLATGVSGGGADTGTGAGVLPFTGGSEGTTPALGDYTTAFTAALARDVQAIWVASEDAAVHAALVAHCTTASHPATKRERRCFIGPALDSAKATQITSATTLAKTSNSDLATVCGTPAKRRNIRTGNLETLSPNQTAAIMFGMAVGVRPEIDLTHKVVNITGLGFDYDDTDLANMIKDGIATFFNDQEDGVHRVTDDVTAWQADTNIMHRLRFGVDIRHYLARKIRTTTKPFVGGVGDNSTVESILNAVETALTSEIRGSQYPEGVLNGYDAITVNYDGIQLVSVTVTCQPVGRIGYIVFTAHLEPTSISLTS